MMVIQLPGTTRQPQRRTRHPKLTEVPRGLLEQLQFLGVHRPTDVDFVAKVVAQLVDSVREEHRLMAERYAQMEEEEEG